jgi:hypothetical protein
VFYMSPDMSVKEMCLQSFMISEKLYVVKELQCTWIENAWAHFAHPGGQIVK